MPTVESIDNSLGEQLHKLQHDSGLTVLLNPRPSFARTFAVMATNFGSLDHHLPREDGSTERVPDGVAHFLEHKLFEDEEGDVSLRFSSRGASCNAATEFTKTSYHFSCVDQVEDNLETLVKFVLNPYFTEESVAKEQGIIEQEIRMYDDDPDWRLFFQLMEAMYHSHPVRLNIAGSVESIQEIDSDLLYRCHRYFYHPSNMVLAVSGGFDLERALKRIDDTLERLGIVPGSAHERTSFDEPADLREKRAELAFSISRSQACLGFKDRPQQLEPFAALRRDLVSRLLLDVLFSQSSPYHQSLYESGVIDDSFEASFSGEEDVGFTIIGGETDDPAEFERAILDMLKRAANDGVNAQDFERNRNRFLGRYVRAFNSAEAVAGTLVSCHFRKISPDDMMDMVSRLTADDLDQRLREHLTPERQALSVLKPLAHS